MTEEQRKEARRLELQRIFLEKAKAKFGETLDFSKVYYVNRTTKICLRCKKHNLEFWIGPDLF